MHQCIAILDLFSPLAISLTDTLQQQLSGELFIMKIVLLVNGKDRQARAFRKSWHPVRNILGIALASSALNKASNLSVHISATSGPRKE